MAKFDFTNSRYAKFFSDKENTRFLQTFLDKKDVFFTNYGWYLTQGKIAANLTPTDHNGLATFSVKCKKLEAAKLMSMRAPLGDAAVGDKKGLEWYSATIPDFIAEGFSQKATELDYSLKQFEEFGNDADIIQMWADNVQDKIDSLDTTMNFLTAKLMSTGEIDYTGIGMGIQAPIHKALIPTENFQKAGEKAWTDSSCNILAQMQKKEWQYREDRGGYSGALVWQMTRKTFYETFLTNSSIKDLYVHWCKAHYVAYVEGMNVTLDQFSKAFSEIQGVSPIEIVTERERNVTLTSDTTAQAWADNIVVLRPAGKVVEFERKEILDRRMTERWGNPAIKAVYGVTNNGLGLLENTTNGDGRFVEWHTRLMLAAVPALTDFMDHVIIDISTKD